VGPDPDGFPIEGIRYAQVEIDSVLLENLGSPSKVEDDGKTTLESVLQAGQRFTYEYDFGDSWVHEVTVEAIALLPEPMTGAQIIDGARAGPPEDVGGSWSYDAILAALASDPTGDEASEFLERMGGGFDPEFFDKRKINAALARRFKAKAPKKT
jgi:hypothetical protein